MHFELAEISLNVNIFRNSTPLTGYRAGSMCLV